MNRSPILTVTGRLAWGRDGTCWAFSRIPGFPYQPGQQHQALDNLSAALSRLHGEFAMWGLCEPITATEIGATVHAGLGVTPILPWQERFRRAYYLAVRLNLPARRRWTVDQRAVVPPARHIRQAETLAGLYDQRLARLAGRPATPSEVAWIIERVMHRGSVDLPVGQRPDTLAGDALADLADCWVTNGGPPANDLAVRVAVRLGSGDDPARTVDNIRHELARRDPGGPALARWARVVGPYGQGFQATLAVEQVPQSHELPGGLGEWLARVDRLGCCVDWHARGMWTPKHIAVGKIRTKLRNIAGQEHELAGDTAGLPPSLVDAYQDLKHEEDQLDRSGQGELTWTSLFTVACTDPDLLEQRVEQIVEHFAGQDYQLPRRIGRQRALLHAQLPCSRYGRGTALWAYRQTSLAAGLVGAAPFCGAVQGDPAGLLLAEDVSSGLRTPLFWQPGYAAAINRSPSIIVAGELGAGKSKAAKRIVVEGLLAAGGRFVGIDATRSVRLPGGGQTGEWTHLAGLVGGETIDIVDGQVTIDPLAMIRTEGRVRPDGGVVTRGVGDVGLSVPDARRMLADALAVACGYDDSTRETDLLARAVAEVAAAGGRAADVIDQLAGSGDPVALEVVDRLATVRDLMPALFDRARRAPNLDARFLVFAAYGLTMPSHGELTNPELSRKIGKAKRCGQAVLLLATGLAKHVGWSTPGTCLIGLDEAWRITTNPFGADIVGEITREGRRYDTGLLIILQNVDSLPEDVQSFAGQVLAFRARGQAAQALARLVGVPVDRIEMLRDLDAGYCWWRTVRGDLNLCRILRPPNPDFDRATDTTPTEVAA